MKSTEFQRYNEKNHKIEENEDLESNREEKMKIEKKTQQNIFRGNEKISLSLDHFGRKKSEIRKIKKEQLKTAKFIDEFV